MAFFIVFSLSEMHMVQVVFSRSIRICSSAMPGKTDADMNMPAIISHADRRVERITVFEIIHVPLRIYVPVMIGIICFFREFSLAFSPLPGNCPYYCRMD